MPLKVGHVCLAGVHARARSVMMSVGVDWTGDFDTRFLSPLFRGV